MLGLGIPEMVLIMVAALLIFGPKRLPEIGQSVGKAMREFKKGVNDIKDNFENVIPEDLMSDEVKVEENAPVSSAGDPSNSDNVANDRSQSTSSSVNETATDHTAGGQNVTATTPVESSIIAEANDVDSAERQN